MSILEKSLEFANSYIITLLAFGFILCCLQPKRKYFILRLIPVIAAGIFLSTDFYRNALSMGGGGGSISTMPYFIGWAIAVLAMWFCFKISFLQALFYQSLCYVIEHMIFNLKFALILTEIDGFNAIWVNAAVLGIRIAIGFAIYFLLTKRLEKLDYLLEYKAVAVIIAAVNVAFTILLNNWFYNRGWFSEALYIVRVLLCIFFVALPFLLSAVLRSKTEKQKLEQMLIDGEKQRRLSEENIEAINRKCHDLKYQVAALRQLAADGNHSKAYDDAVDALEKDVMIYDSIAKTGYGGIDILLTEKSLLCDKKGILFTYMIDVEKLMFMDEVDLYILLGNALDNAIEAVCELPKEQRIINMGVISRNEMTMLSVENFCAKPPQMVDGLPKTTKKDSANHGFGTKSIIGIAEKYGGSVQFFTYDDRFVLNVLFPFRQNTQSL